MTIDFGTHGLDYTYDLCDAIERYTASAIDHDVCAYIHRGMQLRYAVERLLYIQYVSSEHIFWHYQVHRGGSAHAASGPRLSRVESDILFFLCKQGSSADHPPRRRGRLLRRRAKNALARLRGRLGATVQPHADVPQRDILIHVGNSKFANYLAPVTHDLASAFFAYLSIGDEELEERLVRGGYPMVRAFSEVPAYDRFPHSDALFDFLPLVREAEATLAALQMLRPRCVVVVEGNAPRDVITAEACRLLGIPCFCIQQGWSPVVHTGFRNMEYTEMFVWGQRFADLLRPYNPRQSFRVTGSPTVPHRAPRTTTDRIRTIGFFLQAPCPLLGVAGFDAFMDLTISVAESYPDVHVIVREHPGYRLPAESVRKLRACANVHFSIPSAEPLADVISASDIVVSVFSTVLLEALPMNSVPLICSIGPMQVYQPELAAAGAAIEVRSIPEARRVIDTVIADPGRLVPLRKAITSISAQFFSDGDGASNIASILLQAVGK